MTRHSVKYQFGIGILLALVAVVPAMPRDQVTRAHEGIACGSCHERKLPAGGPGDGPGAFRCAECHLRAETNPHDQLVFAAADQSNCLQCHSFHNPQKVLIPGGEWTIRPAGGAGAGHCRACHGPGADMTALSPGHQAAASLYHRQSEDLAGLEPSASCLFCHGKTGDEAWLTAAGEEFPAINLHASHPIGIRVASGGGYGLGRDLDPRLPLFDQRMQCQTCHQLSAGTKDLLIPFPSPYDLCLPCHPQESRAGEPLP